MKLRNMVSILLAFAIMAFPIKVYATSENYIDVPPIIIISSVLITICFIVQLLCCLKLRKWVLKLIPVYGFLLAGLLILLIYFGLYGKSIGNGGFLNTFDFLALVLACELGIAFIGNILAWVVWGMICGIRKLIRMRRK